MPSLPVLQVDRGASSYPVRLERRLSRPPAPLFYKGALPGVGPTVAIVGARAATRRGLRARSRGRPPAAAQAGYQVVSGGAIGIDAAAHEGALASGAPDLRAARLWRRRGLSGAARPPVRAHRRGRGPAVRVLARDPAAGLEFPGPQPPDRRPSPTRWSWSRRGCGRGPSSPRGSGASTDCRCWPSGAARATDALIASGRGPAAAAVGRPGSPDKGRGLRARRVTRPPRRRSSRIAFPVWWRCWFTAPGALRRSPAGWSCR